MFVRICPICADPFVDSDPIVAVMASTYKKIDSDVHYAITTPTQCYEIIHEECYDFPNGQEPEDHHYMRGDSD